MDVFEYGGLDEGFEPQQADIPPMVQRQGPGPGMAGMEDVVSAVEQMRQRLGESMSFLYKAAMEPCRCAYMRDMGCMNCKARELIQKWRIEEANGRSEHSAGSTHI